MLSFANDAARQYAHMMGLAAAETAKVDDAAGAARDEVDAFSLTIDGLRSSMASAAASMSGARGEVDAMSVAHTKNTNSVWSATAAYKSYEEWTKSAATSMVPLSDQMQLLNELAAAAAGQHIPQMTAVIDPWTQAVVAGAMELRDLNGELIVTPGNADDAGSSIGKLGEAFLQFGRQVIDIFANLFDVRMPAWATAGTNAVMGFLDTIGDPTKWQDWVAIGISAATALIGALKEIFGKKANFADHISEFFGRSLSEGIAKAAGDLVSSGAAGDLSAAFRLLIGDAIAESTISSLADLQSWITQVHQVLSSVDEGTLSAAQAVTSMASAWLALVPTMESLGGSAMDLQDQFSDMISRFGATPEVIAAITAAVESMSAAGVDDVGELISWLETMGVTIDSLPPELSLTFSVTMAGDPIATAGDVWSEFMNTVGISTSTTAADIRANWEELGAMMGLSTKRINELIARDMQALRRDTERTLRGTADDLGLTEAEKREFVKAGLKLQRKAQKEASAAERREARETARVIRDARKSIQDDLTANPLEFNVAASVDRRSVRRLAALVLEELNDSLQATRSVG